MFKETMTILGRSMIIKYELTLYMTLADILESQNSFLYYKVIKRIIDKYCIDLFSSLYFLMNVQRKQPNNFTKYKIAIGIKLHQISLPKIFFSYFSINNFLFDYCIPPLLEYSCRHLFSIVFPLSKMIPIQIKLHSLIGSIFYDECNIFKNLIKYSYDISIVCNTILYYCNLQYVQ